MTRKKRLNVLAVTAALLVAAPACGSGADESDGGDGKGEQITFWTQFNTPPRMAKQQETAKEFTRKTGIKVKIAGLAAPDMSQAMVSGAASGDVPDVVLHNADQGIAWNAQGLLDADAANEVIDGLGRDTFNEGALKLQTVDDETITVPSDGWGQMVFYRKDLFAKAGLQPPKTLDDLVTAAETLNKDGTAGIVLGTKPGDPFAAQTLEWIMLTNGCELTKDGDPSEPALDSPACANALSYYQKLAASSVKGAQDVLSTRAVYLAGKAAMISWSPHLLDELAGLDSAFPPTCAECKKDKGFLAKNTGIVTVINGPDTAEGVQYGVTINLGILRNKNTEAAKKFVEFLLSEGYQDSLAVAAEGRYPLRSGPEEGSHEYVQKWADTPMGADPANQQSLSELYGGDLIANVQEGATQFGRWGFGHGSEKLGSELASQYVLTRDLEGLFAGDDPSAVATRMQEAAEKTEQDLSP